jgi:2-dehydropantoate 2-reductase
MRICFLGAGALGSTLGGALARAGVDASLVTSSTEHVRKIERDGLTLRENGVDSVVRVRATTQPGDVGPVDLVIVLVKSFHTREAIATVQPLLAPATMVMSLQNGMGHEDILAEAVGADRVLAGKTYVGGVLLAPGHVVAGLAGKETVIGELDGSVTERVRRVADTFNAAGLLTRVSDNIRGTIWDKLLVNVATGALAAITRLPYGGLYQVPEIRDCALAAVAEAMAVARAQGVALSYADAEGPWIKAAEGMPPEFKTSMLQSIEKGAPTEVDFINGSVVREGEKCGVSTPVNRALVACVKGIEACAGRQRAAGGR